VKSLVLFNNKGGVGKTTLTYHLAHMLARLGLRVVAIDYDPQCNLTAAMLDMAALVDVWELPEDLGRTVSACLEPVRRGRGELRAPRLQEIADRLWLLPGHLSLSRFEQVLAENWPKTMASDNDRALDVVLSLSALAHQAAESVAADVVLCDVGPSLGALNRAALLACDFVAVPLALDLFSAQAIANVGPTLVEWRTDWLTVCERHVRSHSFAGYAGHRFVPLGYIVQQTASGRLTSASQDWATGIAWLYRGFVLGEEERSIPEGLSVETDSHCISQIRHFANLAQIAYWNNKPMFDLKQADGVVGGQIQTVQECKRTFERLAKEICRRMDVQLPETTA